MGRGGTVLEGAWWGEWGGEGKGGEGAWRVSGEGGTVWEGAWWVSGEGRGGEGAWRVSGEGEEVVEGEYWKAKLLHHLPIPPAPPLVPVLTGNVGVAVVTLAAPNVDVAECVCRGEGPLGRRACL